MKKMALQGELPAAKWNQGLGNERLVGPRMLGFAQDEMALRLYEACGSSLVLKKNLVLGKRFHSSRLRRLNARYGVGFR